MSTPIMRTDIFKLKLEETNYLEGKLWQDSFL